MTTARSLEPLVGPHTLAEWHKAAEPTDGERLELIWGHWVVSPAPSLSHQYVNTVLGAVVRDALKTAGRKDLRAVVGGCSCSRHFSLVA